MNRTMKTYLCGVMLGTVLLLSGCGTVTSSFVYDSSFQPNIPQTDGKCYDAAVLLKVDLPRAKDIARKVLIGLDGKILEESDTYIRAMRKMQHFALFVGGGGEELTIRLEKVDDNETFVTATTLTMGGAGHKPWSCKIVNEMVKMASH